MNNKYDFLPNGYQETIQKGLNALHVFSRVSYGVGTREEQLKRLKDELETADAIVIGAGAGLSTSAGLTYSGERFDRYFFDFKHRFGITDIYSGGFYPFPDNETRWAWWARHIYFNRYIDPPKPVYQELFELLKDNYAQQYRDALFCFLRMPDHAATCTEVSKKFGNSPKHYNAKIMNFAKWTQKRLNRFQVIGTDGEPTYWCIPMKCGHDTWQGFNWQLRDELVEALQYYLMKALIIRYREREPFNGFREEYKWALLDETEGKGVLDIIKIFQLQIC